jgi:phage N-6-adenine-methyltransferase
MDWALKDQNRIAELRIRAARKAGAILAHTVKRGGNSQGGSSAPLPEGISWNQSSRWQALAKLPEQSLTRYLAAAQEAEEEVTVSGFLRAGKAKDLAVHFSSERAEWLTPPEVIEAAVEVLGVIDLDPCADKARSVPATKHFTEGDDGLSKEWRGRVYMNPPYGGAIEAWVEKLASSFAAEEVKEAIALLPSRTDTAWFRLLREYPRCFITGRLTFSGHESPAPFPSVVVYLGKHMQKFVRVHSALGDCYGLLQGSAAAQLKAAG